MASLPDDMKEIVKDFLVESQEGIDAIDKDLLYLEEHPDDTERIKAIFRAIHSIKGACGFLGFTKLEKVSHSGENVLSKLRDGHLTLSPKVMEALLQLIDAVRSILTKLEASEEEGAEDFTQLVELLTALAASAKTGSETVYSEPRFETDGWQLAPAAQPTATYSEPEKTIGKTLMDAGRIEPRQLADALMVQQDGDPRRIGEILVDQGAVNSGAVKNALDTQRSLATKGPSLADQNIRVDIGLLDRLMNQMGELVLSRNQLLQIAGSGENASLVAATQKLNRITSELQEGLMMTRMQPVLSQWGKFPRMIRDLAAACGKQVRLEMEGQDTELDRSLLEAIKDPLTHILRNSVDHGIETEEERIALGKPAEGRILLKAFHESGLVVIRISDDGRGLNADRIKAKAVEKGLITEAATESMSDQAVIDLIFLPGFSTAEKVSNVSGRGVGMDVVRTNIEKISGSVTMVSTWGKGTDLTLRIPLTLAIIPALLVKTANHVFATPQTALVEVIRLNAETRHASVENLNGIHLYKYRSNLLPVFHLSRVLKLENPSESESDSVWFVLVLQLEGKRFGLVVDRVMDTQEIVVKALAKRLKEMMVYSGATILGNGEIALILDLAGLASRVEFSRNEQLLESKQELSGPKLQGTRTEQYVVFTTRDGSRFAIALNSIVRLELLKKQAFERSGNWIAIQHGGEILPLLFLDLWEKTSLPENAELEGYSNEIKFILMRIRNRLVGVVVDKILDIVEENPAHRGGAGRDGILWASVLGGHITENPDLEWFIGLRDAGFFKREQPRLESVAA